MKILYKATFIRQFDKLEKDLQDEIIEKIELFKNISNHKNLKVHKLKGKLCDCYGFSAAAYSNGMMEQCRVLEGLFHKVVSNCYCLHHI